MPKICPIDTKNARLDSGKFGPGPAAYQLPTSVGYDIEGVDRKTGTVKFRPRAIPKSYTFGKRQPERYSTIGPGPIPSKKLAKGETERVLTRHGPPTSLKYPFGFRTADLRPEKKPGPPDCQVDPRNKELYDRVRRREWDAPQFSIKHHVIDPYDYNQKLTGPGPAAHKNVNAQHERAYGKGKPQYSIGTRIAQRVERASPGPSAYHPYMARDGEGRPVWKKDPSKRYAPEFSMKYRQAEERRDRTPAANAYNIQSYKGITAKGTIMEGDRAPSWQMGKRVTAPPMIVPEDVC